MADDARSDATAILQTMFNAVETGDIDTFEALCAEGATIWHNYDRKTMPLSETAKGLRAMSQVVEGVRYAERRYVAIPGGAIAEHVLRGTTRSGKRIDAPVIAHIHLTAGKVAHIDEYLDPAQTAPIVAEFG